MSIRLLALTWLIAATVSAQNVTIKVVPPPPDVSAPPADAVTSSTGLASKVITAGSGGDHPSASDLVVVDFTGWTAKDGKMFDSTVSRGRPFTFRVNGVIAGFAEALQLMIRGETRRVWIPENLAYKGAAGKPAGMLVFDLTLREIPTRAPADVKAPPADAQRTASGVAHKVLQDGVGGRHPSAASTVTVNYIGWTTDGKMFDSSFNRNAPAVFALKDVIAGWTEGIQLMVEGEKRRFWIPQTLAYKGERPPFGMLVFDVELLKFQ